METKKTDRGFSYLEFTDEYGKMFNIQKSSLATKDCIWLGIDEPEVKIMTRDFLGKGVGWMDYPLHEKAHIFSRLHLSREQVRDLLPILQHFVDTGEVKGE